ncbi:hypothetical protein GCM10029964_101180 [Kibdelosporangium lantanae]
MRGLFLRTGIAAGVFAVVASSASAADAAEVPTAVPFASCGATLNPSTGSAHAHWDVTCKNGEVTVSGYVQHDFGGGCAYVKAVFEGQITEKSAQSCGFWGGPKKSFKWTHPGSIADAYLTET